MGDLEQTERVILAHGSGGKLSHDLVEKIFVSQLNNAFLGPLEDSALLNLYGRRVAFTTDSYVVSPIFFAGGDIGRLAICGTVNDLSMAGAIPLYLTSGFVIEEGFPMVDLERVVASMRTAAAEAGVAVVAGDTKVVEKGSADGLFINTAGIGLVPDGVTITAAGAKPGDKIVLSGSIGDHGIAVLSQREGLGFETEVQSDAAPLNGLVAAMLEITLDIRCLRDPTRGGLATTLNELAAQSRVGMFIREEAIPIHPAVRGACELLGYDPLYLANEGKLVAVVPGDSAEAMVARMREHQYGREAAIIGEVTADNPGLVAMRTGIGGTRIIDMLTGEMFPRIC
jgi:hydrogenase expression/formation protein HypE